MTVGPDKPPQTRRQAREAGEGRPRRASTTEPTVAGQLPAVTHPDDGDQAPEQPP